MSVKRKWDVSSEEVRKQCVDEVITRLDDMQGDPGAILASDIIDIVAQHIGPDIYNQAIKDTQKLLSTRFADIEVDLDMLSQS